MLDWIQLVALIGLGGAGLLALLWRSAERRVRVGHSENDALRAASAELEATLGKERKARSRQAEELGEFRKRADKAKRRSGKSAPKPMGTASRIHDLEEASDKVALECDRLRTERDGLAAELAQLRARIESEARVAAREAITRPVAPTESDSKSALEASLAQAKERIGKLESEGQASRRNEARMRKRMDNQEQLYASLRSELEVKKDRLRTQEEQLHRLQALKVAVID